MPALLRNIYRRDDEFASPKVDQANYYMMVSKGVSMEVDGRIMIAAMLTLLGVLSLFLSIRLFIAIHQRRTLAERRERTIHMVFALAENQQREQSHSGLDKNILESLPVFVYRRMDFKEAPECAVCLSDFEEDEEGRVLPNCSHSFHVDCIDIWFRNHSICPVCRKDAAPLPTPENPNLTDEGNQNNAETSVWVDSGAFSSPGLRGSPRR